MNDTPDLDSDVDDKQMTHSDEPTDAEERERRNYEMTQEDANLLSHELYLSRGLGGIAEEAEDRLRAKCNWEHMTRTAILMEWGDPYGWV